MESLWVIFVVYVIMAVVSAVLKGAKQRPILPQPYDSQEIAEVEVMDLPMIEEEHPSSLNENRSRDDLEFTPAEEWPQELDEEGEAIPDSRRPAAFALDWKREGILQGIIMGEILRKPRAKRPIRFGDL